MSYPTYEEIKKYIDNNVTDLGQSNEYHKIPLGESYEKVCDELNEFLKAINKKEELDDNESQGNLDPFVEKELSAIQAKWKEDYEELVIKGSDKVKPSILGQAKESADYYGSKFDQGKTNFSLIFSDFPMAIKSVAEVAEFGAKKYSAHSWMLAPDAQERYTNALFRHLMDEMSGEETDSDSEFLHAAHVAWNALARLELMLIEKQKESL